MRPQKTNTLVLCLKLALYLLLAICFFGCMGVKNPQMLRGSRTLAITLSTYLVLGSVLLHVYGGYDVGKQKSKPIIYSLSSAFLLLDIITYVQLQIMNVNKDNNTHFMLFDESFPFLLLALGIQMVLIVVMVYLGNYLFFRSTPPEKCLMVVGSADAAARLRPKIERLKKQFDIAEIVNSRSDGLYDAIRRADTVFLCEVPVELRAGVIEYCYRSRKHIYSSTDVFDIIESSATYAVLDDASFMTYKNQALTMEQRFVKRAVDIFLSLFALILTSPAMLLIALVIVVTDGRPVLFRQKRMTRDGRIFEILKFRTMTREASCRQRQVSATENDARITPVGAFLRKWRLDELPQFFNIFAGDMSVVGPRPEMLDNIDKYTRKLPEFSYRLRVKAGLTGYAQIAGRYNTSPRDKMMFDMIYIENYSLWMDIKLMLRTVLVIFKRDSAEGFVSEEEEKRDVG